MCRLAFMEHRHENNMKSETQKLKWWQKALIFIFGGGVALAAGTPVLIDVLRPEKACSFLIATDEATPSQISTQSASLRSGKTLIKQSLDLPERKPRFLEMKQAMDDAKKDGCTTLTVRVIQRKGMTTEEIEL